MNPLHKITMLLCTLLTLCASCIYDDETGCHPKWGQNAVDHLKQCICDTDGNLLFTPVDKQQELYILTADSKEAAHAQLEDWCRNTFSGDHHRVVFYDDRGSIDIKPGLKQDIYYMVDLDVPGLAVLTVWLVSKDYRP